MAMPRESITTSTTTPNGRTTTTTTTTTFATPTAAITTTTTTTIMPLEVNPGLSHLLSSNTVPRTCEAASVQLQIDYITSQIPRLRSQLEELEEQLRLHRAVLSPVRKVPPEILGEIFTLVLPNEHSSTWDRDKLTKLQLVCRTWRDAARLKHRLWSSLYVDFWDTNLNPKKIERWFMRSGRAPRSLTFYIPAHELEDCESNCQMHNPDLADLLAKGESLDALSLSYSDTQCFQNLLLSLKAVDAPLTHRPWDSLRSLTCIFDDGWTESSDPSKSIFLSLPSSVTSFSLHLPSKYSAFPFESDSAITPLNIPAKFLEQLTSFSLTSDWEGVKWLECTLPFCTSVEKLTLDFGGSHWEYDIFASDVERWKRAGFLLPKVRVLHLHGVLSSMDILFFLKTPQLVDLDITPGGDNDPDEIGWELDHLILGFVKKSSCEASLRTFRLRNLRLHPDQVNELAVTLRGLPFLTQLTLEAVTMVQANCDDIFLLLREGDGPSLPHLEVLELLECSPEVRHYSLTCFLRSRRPFGMKNQKPSFEKPPDTLKALTVSYRPPRGKQTALDEYELIRVLKKWCGVSVHIGPMT